MCQKHISFAIFFRFNDITAGIVNVDFHNNVVFDKLGLVTVVPNKSDSDVYFVYNCYV